MAPRSRTRTARTSKGRAPRHTLAQRADRHVCYELAVQHPPSDAAFIARTFEQLRGRPARILREDFCGTAALCATWVKRHPENRAYGIDLDPEPLNYGIQKHLLPLGRRASRVTLIRRDVRDPMEFRVDAVAAFNFSYFTFHDPARLIEYFRRARGGLVRDGILYLDLFGGPESMELREERTRYRSFTYVWDQAAFNPITHEITCHIHFEFPDRSVIRRAFTYHWRLWQIPELEWLARQAGFRATRVYWEGTDHRKGEGNGIYRPSRKGDNATAFLAYLVCSK
jgi:cyclopropane fatty-acyl-phospholipid synthase-like methyltransferase